MSVPIRACWVVPDDRGGGVVSVAEACCRQAGARGIEATMLMLLPQTGHAAEYASFAIDSLDVPAPYDEAPARLIRWLDAHPQDVILFNGCDQFDGVLPYVPQATRAVYCVHDTAERYFAAALRHQSSLDAVVAVSETVARLVRPRLADPSRLQMIHNGTILPFTPDEVAASVRSDDLLFMGGSNPGKGSDDTLKLWSELQHRGFGGRLHWFGAIDDTFRARIAAAPGSERIVVHGRKPRSEIFVTAMRCKAMLMLSRVEPFGMATIEAMGMGCLPVAWDIDTGTREIVAERFRHVAPLGNFGALADAVIQAIADHPGMFLDSTRDTVERFDESAMGERYAALIGRLMAAPAVARPLAGQPPPSYARPRRLYQLLPSGLRGAVRRLTARWPLFGYLVRDLRGL